MPANSPYDLEFWRDEVDRAVRIVDDLASGWQEHLDYYAGKKKPEGIVNVNVDFYETEQKHPQVFYESPELQFVPAPGFDATAPGVIAFRNLVNQILGPDQADALETVQISLKRCITTSGRGPTIIGYQPTIQPVTQTPMPGAILGLSQSVPVPVHEAFFWDEISDKKFLRPADFTSTNFDKAPWLGMKFRIPLKAARNLFNLPPDFEGTKTRDEAVLQSTDQTEESGSLAYVDGVLLWYKAYLFDDDEIHPEIYRRHVIVEGLETFADKDDPMWRSPYQTKLPDGRLRADSMIGNPIHVFTLRSVPDSAEVPSDGKMRRELVKELNLFREQMVEERDINKLKFGLSTTKFPQAARDEIAKAMTGSLIPLPDDCFTPGSKELTGFAQIAQGSSPRQTYLANDYIERDIAKTSGMDATGVGVDDDTEETATKTAEIAKARNVRLDAERKRILRQYLKAVDSKIAPLVLRFCSDPRRVAELIGPQQAEAYLVWRSAILEMGDVRPKFTSKPDSQIKLDAAQEWRSQLQFYEFTRKDPLCAALSVEVLRKMASLRGYDPTLITGQMPEQGQEMSFGLSTKGEDFNPLSPQFPIMVELAAQGGFTITPGAITEAQAGAQNQLASQMAIAAMQPTGADGKGGEKKPAQHGGTADKVPPMSKHSTEQTGNRPGPSVQ